MRKIVIASAKGGTGKSTTATSLAVGLARRGHKTLIIDADGQGNASWTILGGAEIEGPTLADVLLRDALADEAIRETATPNLDILPAAASLNGANVALVQELGRDARLRSAMAPVDGRWAFVVIDTAPAFSTILANALVYAAEVIVPVDAGMYAMLGLVQLQSTIMEVREAYGNEALHLAGLLLTRVSRNNVHRDVEAGLRERFGPLVFKSVIPLSVQVEAAHTRGQTVMDFARKSPAALAYDQLVSEVIEHGGTEIGGGKSGKRGARKADAA
ncbi:MAG: chromosome segregation ATPase [Planctomycetota bacterium]|nr:chromosome segregation ATPase [Planctomycetota bacterium]